MAHDKPVVGVGAAGGKTRPQLVEVADLSEVTHDPLLALRGDRRLVIRNGGIAEVIETSARERDNLACIEAVDRVVMDIRDRLRRGQRIEENIAWPH